MGVPAVSQLAPEAGQGYHFVGREVEPARHALTMCWPLAAFGARPAPACAGSGPRSALLPAAPLPRLLLDWSPLPVAPLGDVLLS